MSDQQVNKNANHNSTLLLLLHWLVIGIPLAWGIWETFKKALALFH